jgi:hypothetical protein
MVPGVNPEDDRCLFSGVLMEGLWGLRAAAFSRILQDKVTSRSLGAYLAARVPEVAALYRCKVIPTFNTNFPEGDDIYFGDFGDRKRPIPPSFPAWPGPDVFAGLGRRGLSRLESHAEDEEVSDRRDADARSAALLKNRIRSQARPNRQETGAGFAIEGGRVEGLWTPHDVMPEHHRESNWWRVRNEGNPMLLHSAPVLIEFEDGVFAATTALPNFIASVLRGQRGISAIVYRQGYDAPDTSSTAEDALAKMEGGTLRAATDVMDVAVDLRQLKHVDPVLGVISAYLYDSIGDLDNIRRMAYYYARNGQPIPYDIALLAQLRRSGRDNSLSARVPAVEAREPRTKEERSHGWTYSHTPETEGQIGGLWPWMRQGWAFLDDHVRTAGSSLVHPRLIALRNNLEVGRFTTFDSDGAQKLAKAFNLLKHTG